jgi:hypothetical protein
VRSHVLDHALKRSGLTVVVSLMESSILGEVDDPSILRTRLSTPLSPSSTGYRGVDGVGLKLKQGIAADQVNVSWNEVIELRWRGDEVVRIEDREIVRDGKRTWK